MCKTEWRSGKRVKNRGKDYVENHVENVDNI